MQKPSDELLIAYLDGELDDDAAQEVGVAIARDPALAREVDALRETASALRHAFDDVLHESVPERLLAAARGVGAGDVDKIVRFPEPRAQSAKPAATRWHGWAALPIAASLASLVIGGSVGYIVATSPPAQIAQTQQAQSVSAENANWLDNIAGYHSMFVKAGSNEGGLLDIPADPKSDSARKLAQQLPPDFRLPNLKPWGLVFQGARFLFIEGRPATQLFYTTDNKALGPLTVLVGNTSLGDAAPKFDRRGDLNVLSWRHQGHIYALVGTADIGYLWNIHNDLGWQLDAI